VANMRAVSAAPSEAIHASRAGVSTPTCEMATYKKMRSEAVSLDNTPS
jgi:hypothetical protein